MGGWVGGTYQDEALAAARDEKREEGEWFCELGGLVDDDKGKAWGGGWMGG